MAEGFTSVSGVKLDCDESTSNGKKERSCLQIQQIRLLNHEMLDINLEKDDFSIIR